LANHLYRAIGTQVEAEIKELTAANTHKLLNGSQLIVDVFDNSTSRQTVKDYAEQSGISCLHAGLSSDFAEAIWNDVYRVPSDANDDICDYPLARNLVMLTVAVTCEAIVSFIATGEQRSFTITLKDLAVKSLVP
jgi:molybdopterin-synthase adenylyltransferase